MNDYLNIELVYNNLIINTYSLPESTFTVDNQNDLTELMDGIFEAMINDLNFKLGAVYNNGEWDSVNFYILSDDIKINELIRTKDDMNTYNSYGEAILIIYNQIKNIN